MSEKASEKSLLSRFIIDRLVQYTEPERKGTPKGEPIGLSGIKYSATLYLLFDHTADKGDLKYFAGQIGISYNLLRKWRTEEEFKKVILLNMCDFTDVFWNHCEEIHKIGIKKWNAYCNKPIKSTLRTRRLPTPDNAKLNMISDYPLYDPVLRMLISDKLIYESKKVGEDIAKSSTFVFICAHLSNLLGGGHPAKKDKDLQEKKKQVRQAFGRNMLARIIEINMKPSITKEERIDVIIACKVLQEGFEGGG